MRLEPLMWDALASISDREGLSIHGLATEIDQRRGNTAMTSAVRVFVLAYYQRLAADLENRLQSGRPAPPPLRSRAKGSSGASEVFNDVFGAK
jgi:predicted DNA-binding ribbon-helix-helix protein